MTPDPPTQAEPQLPARRSWVIDVCRTCSRLAVWPFCEHRGTGMDPWTEPVIVHERSRS